LDDDPKIWHDRAEEALARATEMTSREGREQLIHIAQSYRRLAEIAERMAQRAESRRHRAGPVGNVVFIAT
jgi:hypothetical protein